MKIEREHYPACIPCCDNEHADDGTGQKCPCCGVYVEAQS